jgi:exodeoxyribonuclease III
MVIFLYFKSAEKKGYSGVALYTKKEPINLNFGFGIEKFDNEGRVIIAEFETFYFLNIYFPNGQKNDERLNYN